MWKMWRKPPGGESTTWTIDGDADFEQAREEILALIEEAATWLDQPASLEDWQQFLEEEGDLMGAAAVAVSLDDRGSAQRLADLALADTENKSKYTRDLELEQVKAMGLWVK